MKHSYVLMLTLFAFALPGGAHSAEIDKPQISVEELHNELRKLKSEVEAAINKGDIDGVLKHTHKDVIFTSLNMGGGRGHAKVREYDDKMSKGPARVIENFHVTFTPDELSLLYGGDTAVSWGTSVGNYKFVTGEQYEINSRWTATLVREDNRWLIASFHISGNLFDNPVLSAVTRPIYWAAGIGALIALVIGFLVGRRRGR